MLNPLGKHLHSLLNRLEELREENARLTAEVEALRAENERMRASAVPWDEVWLDAMAANAAKLQSQSSEEQERPTK